MATRTVSVTKVARRFSDYVSRVAYRAESFVLERGGKPVAELRPLPSGCRLGDLPVALASLPHLSAGEADTFERDMAALREGPPEEPRDPWAS